MEKYRFTPVRTNSELREWLALTGQLYTAPLFVPPLKQHIAKLFIQQTPYSKDIQMRFIAVRDQSNKVVARTTVHTSRKFDEKQGRRVQLFGFTEFVDDFNVFQFLFDEIRSVGQKDGRDFLFGPGNLLPNQSGGVIQSGFKERGFMDSAYNHPYYPEFYRRYGFKEKFKSRTYVCRNLLGESFHPETAFPFQPEKLKSERLEIHYGSQWRFSHSLHMMLAILNKSYTRLDYYTPISWEELRCQTDGLKYILENKLFIFLTKGGRPIGFILCVLDLSEFVIRIKGDLSFLNFFKLMRARKSLPREAILIIKGMLPGEEGKGYMTLLSQRLWCHLRQLGYHTLRSTWVEETNPASASQFLKMNGTVLNDLTFYEMAL